MKKSVIIFAILTLSIFAHAELSSGRYFGKTKMQTGCYADVLVSAGNIQGLKFYYGGNTLGLFNYFVKKVDSKGTGIYFAAVRSSVSSRVITVINHRNSAYINELHFKDAQQGVIDCYQMAIINQSAN